VSTPALIWFSYIWTVRLLDPDLLAERQSARMSKITNDGLTLSGTGRRFIAVSIWPQLASKGSTFFISVVILVVITRFAEYSDSLCRHLSYT